MNYTGWERATRPRALRRGEEVTMHGTPGVFVVEDIADDGAVVSSNGRTFGLRLSDFTAGRVLVRARPSRYSMRPVRRGDLVHVRVEGGYVQAPAKADGIEVETTDDAVVLDAMEVAGALGELGYSVHRAKVEAKVKRTRRGK